ncbi:uncharacterized protein At3g17950 [Malania oleifera]|uniref:uncharacterized protein At3g17950 n=1 Tax=Malania oleifera TaxID=397392 RepID=UPI0025ADDFB5|nr:uncharacterized protein At3g17950 [Malania oleifera]
MADHQEEGWPLGLQPLNVRAGFVRNRNLPGSVSFSTLLTASPTSSHGSSSDPDTQSTGSFFHDKSITLGSLMGISSILELSRRPTQGRTIETSRDRKICKPKPWFFSMCSKVNTDAINPNKSLSLGHYLEAERRAATLYRSTPNQTVHGPDDFLKLPVSCPNTLFVCNKVAPPQPSSWFVLDGEGGSSSGLIDDGNGYGVPLLFSCLCGQLSH